MTTNTPLSEKMKEVALNKEFHTQREYENGLRKSAVLTDYKEDFHKYDMDTIKNDTVEGMDLIWIIKGSGAGTWLFQGGDDTIKGDFIRNRELGNDKDSFYFHIKCDGENSGSVKEINQEMAAKIIDEAKPVPVEKMRRLPISSHIKQHIGNNASKNTEDIKLEGNTKDPFFFKVPSGKSVFFKIEPNPNTGMVRIEKLNPETPEKEMDEREKRVSTENIQIGMAWMGDKIEDKEPTYLKMTGHDNNFYAGCSSINSRQYEQVKEKILVGKINQEKDSNFEP